MTDEAQIEFIKNADRLLNLALAPMTVASKTAALVLLADLREQLFETIARPKPLLQIVS